MFRQILDLPFVLRQFVRRSIRSAEANGAELITGDQFAGKHMKVVGALQQAQFGTEFSVQVVRSLERELLPLHLQLGTTP